MMRALPYILLFTITLVATTVGTKSLMAVPANSVREALHEIKTHQFHESKNDYDVVFVGSSRVHLGINAPEFDRALNDKGYAITSYNYGMDGFRGHEIDHRLRSEILRDRPEKLRFVLIELMPFDDINNRTFSTVRELINWHTPYQTFASIQGLWSSGQYPPRNRQLRIYSHVLHMTLKYSTLGHGLHFLDSLRRESKVDPSIYQHYKDELGSAQGYLSQEVGANGATRTTRKIFLKRPERYLWRVAALSENSDKQPSRSDIHAFDRQVKAIRAGGAIPVYFTYPTPVDYAYVDEYEARHPETIFLRFDDPKEFEWAYAIESRHDVLHLNDEAAAKLTRILAERFLDEIEARYPEVMNSNRLPGSANTMGDVVADEMADVTRGRSAQ